MGGPDGGHGGKGGDIVLVADKNLQDLSDFFYAPRAAARRGEHGRGKNQTGRSGTDVILRVPVGTQVYRLSATERIHRASRYLPAAVNPENETDELVDKRVAGRERSVDPDEVLTTGEFSGRELIADLTEDGQKFVLANGGRGGRGNSSYKSSTNRAPRQFEFGEPGEELDAELELKTIADVGLVGYPNAGKSTLISKITHAHPKIASYPFTTLTPNVGVMTFDDFARIRVADIPGLIEGAHKGRGLGHDFLRHVERCRVLLFLIDMAGVDNRKPWDDYKKLLQELKLHDATLLDRPRWIVANKMDLPEAKKNLETFKRKLTPRKSTSTKTPKKKVSAPKVVEISALEGEGLDKLKLALRKVLA
jgi:GTP-binding protein